LKKIENKFATTKNNEIDPSIESIGINFRAILSNTLALIANISLSGNGTNTLALVQSNLKESFLMFNQGSLTEGEGSVQLTTSHEHV